MSTATDLKQGIREHLGQFSLHVLLMFATGLTIGSERAVVPVLDEDVPSTANSAGVTPSASSVVRMRKTLSIGSRVPTMIGVPTAP